MSNFIHKWEPEYTCSCGIIESYVCTWCGGVLIHSDARLDYKLKKELCPGEKDES